MKNRYILLFMAAALAATSCNKFLDTMPDARTELNSKEKLVGLLVSAYPTETPAVYLEMMSDDHDDIGTEYAEMSNYNTTLEEAWNWRDITAENDSDSPKASWDSYYRGIAAANQVLKAIENLGNPQDYNALVGEALMCRAYNHFKLVNIFCMHYNEEESDNDLGIPYAEEPETEVNPKYERGTVAEVYEKIHQDIQAGLPLIDDNLYTVPKYHFTRAAALGFAVEFYLYYRKTDAETNDYLDYVIDYANEVLGADPGKMLHDVSGFRAMNSELDIQGRAYVDSDENSLLLLTTNHSAIGQVSSNYYYSKRYLHNSDISDMETLSSPSVLWGSNKGGDALILPMFMWRSTPGMYTRLTVPRMIEWLDPVAGTGWVRSIAIEISADNVLLNRAEAYVLKGDLESAMRDINVWISKRVQSVEKSGGQSDPSPKTVEQVLEYYGSNMHYYGDEVEVMGTKVKAWTPKKKLNPSFHLTEDQEAFIHAILHIRRIEHWGEGKRWFDVKRYGIEILRRQFRITGDTRISVEDQLMKDDPRRAIQIPAGVIAAEAGLEPNPR